MESPPPLFLIAINDGSKESSKFSIYKQEDFQKYLCKNSPSSVGMQFNLSRDWIVLSLHAAGCESARFVMDRQSRIWGSLHDIVPFSDSKVGALVRSTTDVTDNAEQAVEQVSSPGPVPGPLYKANKNDTASFWTMQHGLILLAGWLVGTSVTIGVQSCTRRSYGLLP